MTDPATQLDHFHQAVALLGGPRSAARAVGMSERSMARFLAGQVTLHQGVLRDMAAALIAHADACRTAERRLSPAFAGNLIPGQPREDGRRRRHQEG